MKENSIDIKTADGTANAWVFHPETADPWPSVIIYMDAFGIRPDLVGMARRLAASGYCVLLPNLYYRAGRDVSFSPNAMSGPQGEKIMAMVRSLSNKMMMSDTRAYLQYLEGQKACNAEKVGCVGYCMGGPFALSAAGTFPDKIAAAASFHGGRLATDKPDSPHLLAPKMKGTIYIGVAGIDQHFSDEEKNRLETALKKAGVNYTLEVYPGAKHGFAVNGTPAYDPVAAETHWQRMLELFQNSLH